MRRTILLVTAILTILFVFGCSPFWGPRAANSAEIAIRWTEPLPGSNYELGDIILVLPDGSDWGTKIDPRINPDSNFIIVQLTGLPVDDFYQYFQPLWDMADPENPFQLKKRQFKFDRNKIPQNIINHIRNSDGFLVVTEEQWNNFITNKEGLL